MNEEKTQFMPSPEKKIRKCLKCGVEFESMYFIDKGICFKCTE